jgi:hypothetical protein
MRRLVPSAPPVFLGAGRDPGEEGRRALRDAGVPLAIFDPVDLHTLRFQLNRALAGDRVTRQRRRTLRAPAVVKSRVDISFTPPGRKPTQIGGRVVMTNVPGNVMRRSLPFGMGIQFEHIDEATSVALLIYAESRYRALSV